MDVKDEKRLMGANEFHNEATGLKFWWCEEICSVVYLTMRILCVPGKNDMYTVRLKLSVGYLKHTKYLVNQTKI